jgi:hypothetical protein
MLTLKHPLEVGSVLQSIREDGNLRFVRFFKVIRLVGDCEVELVELETTKVLGEFGRTNSDVFFSIYGWKGSVAPSDREMEGVVPRIYTVGSTGIVRISSVWTAVPWDGGEIHHNSLDP